MTKDEWNSSRDPAEMLEFLRSTGRLTERKATLFAAACCRRIWHMLTDASRNAVEVAERCADFTTLEELDAVTEELHTASRAVAAAVELAANLENSNSGDDEVISEGSLAAGAAMWTLSGIASEAASCAAYASAAHVSAANEPAYNWEPDFARDRCMQCCLLRDLFGPYLFRPLLHIDPALRQWDSGAVGNLAQSIYDASAFRRMPELAVLLEDAGCTNADILAHCRQLRDHVRGCWLLDMLIGKQ